MDHAVRDQLRAIVIPTDHAAARNARVRTGLFQSEDRHVRNRASLFVCMSSRKDIPATVNEL